MHLHFVVLLLVLLLFGWSFRVEGQCNVSAVFVIVSAATVSRWINKSGKGFRFYSNELCTTVTTSLAQGNNPPEANGNGVRLFWLFASACNVLLLNIVHFVDWLSSLNASCHFSRSSSSLML